MSEDLNRVIIIGRLTRPAEKATTANGQDLIKFSVAVNQRRKQNDQWVDVAHYFDVVYWGKRAVGIHPYLGKGQQVAIEGQLRQNRWEQEGKKRSKVEIEANSVQLLGGKSEGNNNALMQEMPTSAPPSSNFEDDVPFAPNFI